MIFITFLIVQRNPCVTAYTYFVFLSRGLMRTTVHFVDVDSQKVSKPSLRALQGR